ncbi:MAG TPA: hypothetical protein VFE57_03605 [Cyclobacteriaceae bacterium]|jgi:frataxin-like iron-binding protein CyaY|nr:hypothetical protein [Cyclobacteriaceae bacterium]
MKLKLTVAWSLMYAVCLGQVPGRVLLQGDFHQEDSAHIVQSYVQAQKAVEQMYNAMNAIWNASPQSGKSKMEVRAERWRNDATFMKWLGEPGKMKLVAKNIRKIHRKFDKKFILEVVKEDEGRCNRFVGAWAVPYGRVKMRLCRNYLNFRTDQSSKILIHEVGHETGMLFHKDLFSCRDVLQAAAAGSDEAKRSPETYAWLAMSYMGLDCFSRGRF